jgi:hypothetical protein
MMTTRFTVASDAALAEGTYEGTIYEAHEVFDSAKGGAVIRILWNVNDHYITENLAVSNPDPKKAAFFQKKFRRIVGALNMPAVPEGKQGEEVSYDLSTLLGKKCGVEVIHKDYNGNTYVNIKDYVILSRPTPAPQKEQDGLSRILDDELSF